MQGHYNYFQHITPDHNWQKLLLGICVAMVMILVGRACASKISAARKSVEGKRNGDREAEGTIDNSLVIPTERPTLFGIFDVLIESFLNFHDSVLGKENRKYFALSATIFFFILLSNLVGLIPGMPAVTTTVWINVAIALVVFVLFNYYGIKENGLWGYLRHMGGPVLLLAPIVFVLEMFSNTLRILTLNLRLYWNITADHLVLETFTGLTKAIIPSAFYLMGTFVSFMQAFVFTILTMIYILLATQHEEGH